jgi:hypothetical protein
MGDKVYLGDSVYAQFDGFGIILTTENGLGPTNTIVLEPEVLGKFSGGRRMLERSTVSIVRLSW